MTVLAGASSCEKSIEQSQDQIKPSGKPRQVTITAGSAQTKTNVSGGALTWSANDKLNIVPQSGSVAAAELNLKSGAGTATGTFEGTIDASITDATELYGWCGGSWTYDSGSFSVDMPATQTYVANGLAENAYPSIGTGSIIDGINLSNPMGVLKLTVKGLETDLVKSISVISAAKNLAGSFTVNPSSSYAVSGGSSKTVTLSVASPYVALSESGVNFYIMLPPAEYAASDLSVKVTFSDDLYLNMTINEAVSVTAGSAVVKEISYNPVTDLCYDGTANSYIVSATGNYKFKTVQGNSSTSVGTVSTVSVLWESFGTDTAPSAGSLIKTVGSYKDDSYLIFSTNDSFKEGNAVIAAKDASGKILWSWHIWLTDKPSDQVYNNSAGTMMDRNLGATSAEKGQVGALGLLYQWGRKDPFLSSSSISGDTIAASTLSWPSAEDASSHLIDNITLAYSIANPTTFLKNESDPYDWYCTSFSSYKNDKLWSSTKSIYDPCPVGYRVPDGDGYVKYNGVWSKAFKKIDWISTSDWDETNKGMDFGLTDEKLGTGTIWYPGTGTRGNSDHLQNVGNSASYWSCTPTTDAASILYFHKFNYVITMGLSYRGSGNSVRCLKE